MNLSIADLNFNIVYYANGQRKTCKSDECDDFSLRISRGANTFDIHLFPLTEISFEKFEVYFERAFENTERIFVNGYQSWTVSREYAPKDKMEEFNPKFLGFDKKKFNPRGIWGAGDLLFHDYPEKSGVFYGYTYGYVRQGNNIDLYGSRNERNGFSIITFDTNNSVVKIEKDFEGVKFSSPQCLVSMYCVFNGYEQSFRSYFRNYSSRLSTKRHYCGYTTWYNYYTNINEDIVYRDLEALTKLKGVRINYFQIDDGYEETVGDWLDYSKKKFPQGMKQVADRIHKHRIQAGLWLAPFAATPKSKIFKEHKDWFVRDKNGKLSYASHNWGGFYALDIYNPAVREYLRHVFDVVLNEWGYDLVKLDFLYACCIQPIHGKSRGEIMDDAMVFLRECCGDKKIIGCGVPLAPAFGRVDFCRIGPDIGLTWENKAFSREDVSTQHAVLNTIFRRHLNGNVFLNDPDVFILRDSNIKMTMSQRELVAKINSVFGKLLFVSDNVAEYSPRQLQVLKDTFSSPKAKIISASIDVNDDITFSYKIYDKVNTITFNLKTGIVKPL